MGKEKSKCDYFKDNQEVGEVVLKPAIEKLQDEYFETLIRVCSNDETLITKGKEYHYWFEKLKELQQLIIMEMLDDKNEPTIGRI